MNLLNLPGHKYRYERKFYLPDISVKRVESLIKLNPLVFSEIYYQRNVNNIYFDTPNLTSYCENVHGLSQKLKVRIRWYGNFFGHIGNPTLEFKVKKGAVGGKISYPLPPFELRERTDFRQFKGIFQQSALPDQARTLLKGFSPAVVNHYQRKYFRCYRGNYRITLDHDLAFYRIGPAINYFCEKYHDRRGVVLEIKYDSEFDQGVTRITAHFPFRLATFSKYKSGIERLLNKSF